MSKVKFCSGDYLIRRVLCANVELFATLTAAYGLVIVTDMHDAVISLKCGFLTCVQ